MRCNMEPIRERNPISLKSWLLRGTAPGSVYFPFLSAIYMVCIFKERNSPNTIKITKCFDWSSWIIIKRKTWRGRAKKVSLAVIMLLSSRRLWDNHNPNNYRENFLRLVRICAVFQFLIEYTFLKILVMKSDNGERRFYLHSDLEYWWRWALTDLERPLKLFTWTWSRPYDMETMRF